MLLGIDIGTSHIKAGLFHTDGTVCKISTRPTPARRAAEGYAYFDPEELWQTAATVIQEASADSPSAPGAVGVAGMAETGLIVDRKTGAPRSFFIPWFDTSAEPMAELIRSRENSLERFIRTGIRASFKAGLSKILWLRSRQPEVANDAIWLSAPDYIVYRLTGQMGTDYSLATRTYAFRIDTRTWDAEWIREFGLSQDLFPEVHPGGTALGKVQAQAGAASGLPSGIPVAVSGHDHVCAALAAGAIAPGLVLDSMGTAETLVGALPRRALGEKEYRSGLVYGAHVVPDLDYWMGGLSASGRSVEWFRGLLGDPALSYEQLESLLAQASEGPTGILYFPYLLGNQSRAPNAHARAALIGLADFHNRSDVLLAVLEGTAYEMETIRHIAEETSGIRVDHLVASGGGIRNHRWMQVKADVSNCRIDLSPIAEATLLGAALAAGIDTQVYSDAAQAIAAIRRPAQETFLPDPERRLRYRSCYEENYLAFEKIINKRTNK